MPKETCEKCGKPYYKHKYLEEHFCPHCGVSLNKLPPNPDCTPPDRGEDCQLKTPLGGKQGAKNLNNPMDPKTLLEKICLAIHGWLHQENRRHKVLAESVDQAFKKAFRENFEKAIKETETRMVMEMIEIVDGLKKDWEPLGLNKEFLDELERRIKDKLIHN